MPLSYVFLEARLADAQRHVLRGLVFEPLHDRLAAQLVQSSCGLSATADTDAAQQATTRPQDLPSFVAGTQLVNEAAQTERWIGQYNELVQAGSGNLVMLTQLMREAAGVQLAPEHVGDRTQLDAALRATSVDDGTLPLGGALAASGLGVLFATGRQPNTQSLHLDNAGVAIDARGCVRVDAWQATNVEGVYAVGDVTGQLALVGRTGAWVGSLGQLE